LGRGTAGAGAAKVIAAATATDAADTLTAAAVMELADAASMPAERLADMPVAA
jgi:hypothetical protein